MKKMIIVLLLIMGAALSVLAQKSSSYYTAYKTEIRKKLQWQEEWEIVSVMKNVNISIAFTGNTLQINAERASVYMIDPASSNEFEDEEFKVISFTAYEITRKENCKVDFVKLKNTDQTVLSVTFLNGNTHIALHYFLVKD